MGGAGGGGRPPPLSLDQTEARKAEKKFLETPPPLLIWRFLIRHCKRGKLGNKIPRLL